MLKITLFTIFAICITTTSSAPAKDSVSNSEIDSEEIERLFPDPNNFTIDKLPMSMAVKFKAVAEKGGVTLDEFVYFVRLGMIGKKNEKEGKSADHLITKESVCSELNQLPTVPEASVVPSEMYWKVKLVRVGCAKA